MSVAKVRILGALLDNPEDARYGYELMRGTGVKSGTLYPVLEQLESAGWLEAAWEDLTEETAGRPPRRWYRLTALGLESARSAIETYLSDLPTLHDFHRAHTDAD